MRFEDIADVRAPFCERKPALTASDAAGEQVEPLRAPERGELAGKRGGRPMAALEGTVRVGWNERERQLGRGQAFDHDLREVREESAEPAFLPRRDDRTHAFVVGDGGACPGERQAPSRAFAAAMHRPCGGSPTAFAPGSAQARERKAALVAELYAPGAADDAPLRQDELEEHRRTLRAAPTRARPVLRSCCEDSAPRSDGERALAEHDTVPCVGPHTEAGPHEPAIRPGDEPIPPALEPP